MAPKLETPSQATGSIQVPQTASGYGKTHNGGQHWRGVNHSPLPQRKPGYGFRPWHHDVEYSD